MGSGQTTITIQFFDGRRWYADISLVFWLDTTPAIVVYRFRGKLHAFLRASDHVYRELSVETVEHLRREPS